MQLLYIIWTEVKPTDVKLGDSGPDDSDYIMQIAIRRMGKNGDLRDVDPGMKTDPSHNAMGVA